MEISKQVIDILDYIGEKFGIAIDWTSSNIIPYLQELCGKLINYEIATSIVWIVICTIGVIIGIIACITLFKEDLIEIAIPVILIVIFPCLCALVKQIFDIVECCTFPEKFIIEYIQTIMNNMNE